MKTSLSILLFVSSFGVVIQAHRGSHRDELSAEHGNSFSQNRTLVGQGTGQLRTGDSASIESEAFFFAYDHEEAVSGEGTGDHFCGSPSPDSKESVKNEALMRRFHESQVAEGNGRRVALCNGCIVIHTYFHIITNDERSLGYISNETINLQFDLLNTAFSGSPFTFELKGSTFSQDSSLFFLETSFNNHIPSMQATLGELLRKGNKKTLNIYVASFRPVGLGVATFPSAFDGIKDGVFLDYCTMPGGNCPPYSSGEIPVHEVGHWLGLLHVFEGGCDEAMGDHVADTPAQANALLSCSDPPSDSCPNLPGVDPVDNYMGYAPECARQFTPGQWERMHDQWYIYRDGSGGCYADEGILSIEIKLDDNPEDNFWRIYHANGQLVTLGTFGATEKGSMFDAQICLPYGTPMYFGLGDSMVNGLARSQDSVCRIYFDGKPLKDDRTFEAWAGAAFTVLGDDACAPNEGLVTIELLLDDYPKETSWWIEDELGAVVYAEGEYKLLDDYLYYTHASIRRELCLATGGYSFIIQDSYGDGLAEPGPGDTPFFRIIVNEREIIDETGFISWEQTTSFTVEERVLRVPSRPKSSQTPSLSTSRKPSDTGTLPPTTQPSEQTSAGAETIFRTADTTEPLTLLPTNTPSVAMSELTGALTTSPTKDTSPTQLPTLVPTTEPSSSPTVSSTVRLTAAPSGSPSSLPTVNPTARPTTGPTPGPTPTESPSFSPTSPSTTEPSQGPTIQPTASPSGKPTKAPTVSPTTAPAVATGMPTVSPTNAPTVQPTTGPTPGPTPTERPSFSPNSVPSTKPSERPTIKPTASPTKRPTKVPSDSPTLVPTVSTMTPTVSPTDAPTARPTPGLTPEPTPTERPSFSPTSLPSAKPSVGPTILPTAPPTGKPTMSPTERLTFLPTSLPTTKPSWSPTKRPTLSPTASPTAKPSKGPSYQPSASPTGRPTLSPTERPTFPSTSLPTGKLSKGPTSQPTASPTLKPSWSPTERPTLSPTALPTAKPSMGPTYHPTTSPTTKPTSSATEQPTFPPTSLPTGEPSQGPTGQPTTPPTLKPSWTPTESPTFSPTALPSAKPSEGPTYHPTTPPTRKPTSSPTEQPTFPPTSLPTRKPTESPTLQPTLPPTVTPTISPTDQGERFAAISPGWGLEQQATSDVLPAMGQRWPSGYPNDKNSLVFDGETYFIPKTVSDIDFVFDLGSDKVLKRVYIQVWYQTSAASIEVGIAADNGSQFLDPPISPSSGWAFYQVELPNPVTCCNRERWIDFEGITGRFVKIRVRGGTSNDAERWGIRRVKIGGHSVPKQFSPPSDAGAFIPNWGLEQIGSRSVLPATPGQSWPEGFPQDESKLWEDGQRYDIPLTIPDVDFVFDFGDQHLVEAVYFISWYITSIPSIQVGLCSDDGRPISYPPNVPSEGWTFYEMESVPSECCNWSRDLRFPRVPARYVTISMREVTSGYKGSANWGLRRMQISGV